MLPIIGRNGPELLLPGFRCLCCCLPLFLIGIPLMFRTLSIICFLIPFIFLNGFRSIFLINHFYIVDLVLILSHFIILHLIFRYRIIIHVSIPVVPSAFTSNGYDHHSRYD
jgi:hypothetical protein